MSDTPRTDAWYAGHVADSHHDFHGAVMAHARQLERELRQAQDELMMKAQQCSAERVRADAAERDLAKERCKHG